MQSLSPSQSAEGLLSLAIQALNEKRGPRRRLLGLLFPEQLSFVNDRAPFKSAICTRRAGKSWSAGVLLYLAALEHPDSISLYLALTHRSAKNILWKTMKEIAIAASIPIEAHESGLTIKLKDNEAEIHLLGADMANLPDRLRGGKHPRIVIDEAQSFNQNLEEFIDGILTPTLIDYEGDIILVGTPGPLASGYFFDVTEKGKFGYSVHRWSILNNPYIPNTKKFIGDLKRRKGWSDENPTYRREWLGQWVQDPDALVYKFNKERNTYQNLPIEKEWHRILGIDYGFNDQTAFSIISYNPHDLRTFVEYASGRSNLIPSQIAQRVQNLIGQFSPIKIVADTGGLGKSITEEMVRRYGIAISPAKKTEKLSTISLLNGAFIDGHLLVHESLTDLHSQYETLVKDDKGMENPNLPNDLCVDGDSYLLTDNGPKKLKEIRAGDFVLTHKKRFRKVQAAMRTGFSEVIRLKFSNGNSLICTGSHPIRTTCGYVRADALTYGVSCIVIDGWSRLLNLTASSLDATRRVNTPTTGDTSPDLEKAAANSYIGRFGNFITRKSLRVGRSTIETAILIITRFKTSNAFLQPSTRSYIPQREVSAENPLNLLSSYLRSGLLQKYGTRPPPELSGTGSTQRTGKKSLEKLSSTYVQFAAFRTDLIKWLRRQCFTALINAELKLEEILGSITNLDSVLSANLRLKQISILNKDSVADLVTREILTKRDVYNLTVEEDHSYFADGIATSNCDAVLYAWRESQSYIPSPRDKKLDPLPGHELDLWEKRREELQKQERAEEFY